MSMRGAHQSAYDTTTNWGNPNRIEIGEIHRGQWLRIV